MTITDVNADRSPVIQALREQLGKVVGSDPAGVAKLRRERAETARAIDLLESEIDRHHRMVHADDEAGMSYRRLVGELVELEAGPTAFLAFLGCVADLPARTLLRSKTLPIAWAPSCHLAGRRVRGQPACRLKAVSRRRRGCPGVER